MLGLLCGNALGGPAEGRWRTQIEDEWPGGAITEIDPRYAGERLDDDAAQAAELARALLEADEGGLAEAFARRMVDWLDGKRIVTVSVETMRIVRALPPLTRRRGARTGAVGWFTLGYGGPQSIGSADRTTSE